jgi:raffinose/stachyose/melibiose transport system permease protein
MSKDPSIYSDDKKYRIYRLLSGTGRVLGILIPIIFFIVIVYPFIWMLLASFKTTNEIFDNIWGFPEKWQFGNYIIAWKSGISKYFVNSIIVTAATCLLNLIICCMFAFALSFFEFKGKRIFYTIAISGLMFSPIVSLIPLYQEIQVLHMYDSLLALILIYIAYQMPMSIMIILTAFKSIDHAFMDAAKIDGCNSFKILTAVFMPVSKPIMLTSIVLTAFYAWNEFSFALTFIKTKTKMTIPIGLISFQGEMHTEWSILLAGLVISALPIIVFFIFSQKYFIAGLNAGGVKG